MRSQRPATTTIRRHGMFLDVPPLQERVMDAHGRKILETIAACERSMAPCRAGNLPDKKANMANYHYLRTMQDLGLVTIHTARAMTGTTERYTLTDDGWDMAGGKPEWMRYMA